MKAFEYIDDDTDDMSDDVLLGDAMPDSGDVDIEWQSVRRVPTAIERDGSDRFTRRPLPYDLVTLIWNLKSGENLTTARCHQIAQGALHHLLRELSRGIHNMGDISDDFSVDRARRLFNEAEEMALAKMARKKKKKADTDVVGGGGTDAPGTED